VQPEERQHRDDRAKSSREPAGEGGLDRVAALLAALAELLERDRPEQVLGFSAIRSTTCFASASVRPFSW
jgi:hypothetical protein